MTPRRCIDCGRPTARRQRCPAHTAAHLRRQKQLRNAETQRCREAVEAWRATHGNWCPGWQREAHPTADLTAQHRYPFIFTGGGGPLDILCRSCNAREGATRKAAPTEWGF